MKTIRKDQIIHGINKVQERMPVTSNLGTPGEEEEFDPREADLEDDDETGSKEYQDYDHPNRSNP